MSAESSTQDANVQVAVPLSRLPQLKDEPLESPSPLQTLGYLLTNPGKNYLLPVEWLRALLKRSKSPLIAESFVRPGGWRSMELVYRNVPPIDWLDRQALRDNPISMAARNRRKIICDNLTRLIKQHHSDEKLSILGIGAGPGWHIQTAIADAGIEPNRVTAYLIDLDDDAFAYGKKIANLFGIDDSVRFLQGNASQIRSVLPGTKFHLAKMVGIIEYLSDEQLVGLLDAVREAMVPGGHLITHGLVDRYGTGHFLSRVFQLRHHQRDAEQLTNLLNRTGFAVTECEYEPTRIHPIVTAVRE